MARFFLSWPAIVILVQSSPALGLQFLQDYNSHGPQPAGSATKDDSSRDLKIFEAELAGIAHFHRGWSRNGSSSEEMCLLSISSVVCSFKKPN